MGLFGKKDDGKQATNDGKYTIIKNNSLEQLIEDINNMAENGWRCVNISPASTGHMVMYALMEKI